MIFLIADDEEHCRSELKKVLNESCLDVQKVCEARDGREALEQALEHKPAAVFLDFSMPPVNGDKAAADIWSAFPEMPVIVVSSCNRKRDLARFEKFRPQGTGFAYVVKGASKADLLAATDAALRGESWIDPLIQ